MSERRGKFNYGASREAGRYIPGISGHPDIPQSVERMRRSIADSSIEKGRRLTLLDVGCGPGQNSELFAEIADVVGVDVSPEFIQYARSQSRHENAGYIESDYLNFQTNEKFDVIVIQGVIHHLPEEQRKLFIEKASSDLLEGGILIVGDEFLPNYANESERKLHCGPHYSRIIAEAMRGGFDDLAYDECVNLIADSLSGEDVCGYYDDAVIEFVKKNALKIYERLFGFGNKRFTIKSLQTAKKKLLMELRARAARIKESGTRKGTDPGDRKSSLANYMNLLKRHFRIRNVYTFGPVDQIGGMGVIIAQKEEVTQHR
jgi:SAM-dependent methyltransferase